MLTQYIFFMQMILNMNTTLMTSYAAFFYRIDKLIQ